MNIKRTIQVSVLSIFTLAASNAALAADRDTTTEESKGALIGGVIGAAVGGPMGAGLGAMLGGGLVGKLVGERRVNQELSHELQRSAKYSEQLDDHMQLTVDNLSEEMHRLVEMQTVAINATQLPIQFKTNSSDIEDHYDSQLGEFVALLSNNPEANVVLSGYSDRRGDAEYNLNLSEKRIAGVKQFLIDEGVDESQILSQAYGETEPLSDDESIEGHFFDRRVVVEYTQTTSALTAAN